MVRAYLDTGDFIQLRHPGHVSAVCGRCLRNESLQNIAGKCIYVCVCVSKYWIKMGGRMMCWTWTNDMEAMQAHMAQEVGGL